MAERRKWVEAATEEGQPWTKLADNHPGEGFVCQGGCCVTLLDPSPWVIFDNILGLTPLPSTPSEEEGK